MIRIINNTDIDFRRLLKLYETDLNKVKGSNIESIVFDNCGMMVFGNDSLLLEVNE